MENSKERARKRQIIVDTFYPSLVNATISVNEAKDLISAMANLLMEDTLNTMKERKFADIAPRLHKVLCEDGERQDEIKALLDTLKDENLFVAREIIEGMTRAIDVMVSDELKGRKLDTLKADWDKYLNA
jgi:hypothetical protein